MQVNGKIEKILPEISGKTKDDKDWKKVQFTVRTSEEYNNLYCFEIFGLEKVSEFLKYRKQGDDVEVKFNVQTNEYQGKYYTSLQAWSVFGNSSAPKPPAPDLAPTAGDDLPF